MEVTVYADLLFLINAGMDGLCFCLTAKLLHRKLTPGRWILGSAAGGLYAVLALFPAIDRLPALLLDLAACVLLCAVTFGGRAGGGWRRLPPATAVYIVISMMMGGVMTALYNLFNLAGIYAYFPAADDGPGTWLFLILAAGGGLISLWGCRFFRRSAATRTCTVTVEIDGRSADMEALVDTGNRLRDPVGGRAVICVDPDALAPVLPASLREAIAAGHMDPARLADTAAIRRLRLIPTGTATGTGLLWGILPDRVEITAEGKRGPRRYPVEAVVAAAGEHLEVAALVPAELIE